MITLSKKDHQMINRAFEASEEATHKFRIGCVVYAKKPIAITQNEGNKTHPNLPGLVNKLHAEMRALKYLNNVQGAVMVVVRGSKQNPRLARPCSHCLDIIKEAGIKKVIFTTDAGFEILKL